MQNGNFFGGFVQNPLFVNALRLKLDLLVNKITIANPLIINLCSLNAWPTSRYFCLIAKLNGENFMQHKLELEKILTQTSTAANHAIINLQPIANRRFLLTVALQTRQHTTKLHVTVVAGQVKLALPGLNTARLSIDKTGTVAINGHLPGEHNYRFIFPAACTLTDLDCQSALQIIANNDIYTKNKLAVAGTLALQSVDGDIVIGNREPHKLAVGQTAIKADNVIIYTKQNLQIFGAKVSATHKIKINAQTVHNISGQILAADLDTSRVGLFVHALHYQTIALQQDRQAITPAYPTFHASRCYRLASTQVVSPPAELVVAGNFYPPRAMQVFASICNAHQVVGDINLEVVKSIIQADILQLEHLAGARKACKSWWIKGETVRINSKNFNPSINFQHNMRPANMLAFTKAELAFLAAKHKVAETSKQSTSALPLPQDATSNQVNPSGMQVCPSRAEADASMLARPYSHL